MVLKEADTRRINYGTIGCLAVVAFFFGHVGFALINPEYYAGSTVHLICYVLVPAGLGLIFLALALTS
jgi:hypothetical protein